jgi:hypothetical protein
MADNEEEARARYRYLQLKQKAASSAQPQEEKPESETGIWNALTTKDLDGASMLDPLAQTARLGQFANQGNQQLASVIAEQGGMREAGTSDGGGYQIPLPRFLAGGQSGQTLDANAIPSVLSAGALGTASEFLLPQNRLGVAGYALSPLMKGYQALRGTPASGGKPGVVAQLGQARTKVPAGDIQQAINDPSVFEAASVSEANKAYGTAAGPLQSAARSLRTQTGKVLLGEGDWAEAINRPGRILAGTELAADGSAVKMDPQTALESVQSINRFMRNKVNTSKLDAEQVGELLKQKDALLTFLESNGTTGMREAAMGLRKAHVRENLSRIMPQNKFGGTDALRTMGAGTTMAGAGALALAGHPLAAIPLAIESLTASPAVWGGAIRNYQSLANPAVIGAAGSAITASQNIPKSYVVKPKSDLADYYGSRR